MRTVSSLYLHVPFCRHLCNYCDFYKRRFDAPAAQLAEYHSYLRDAWERHESLLREHGFLWGPLETLYLGGGTPSLWGEEGAAFLASLWGGKVPLAQECEATMEIDPGSWTEHGLRAWSGLGVNRFSLGTQSLDPRFLRILDRPHGRDETEALLERLKGTNFSVDFLLGVPLSRPQGRQVLRELEELLSWRPAHVSLYILNPAGGYPLKAEIPDDEWSAHEYLEVSNFLQSRGYRHYEVSNFALPGKESRHNLRYWLGESVAALGPTGTGYFALGPERAQRYQWKPSRAEVEIEVLGEKEVTLERTYLRLRLDKWSWAEQLMPGHEAPLSALMRRWEERGLAETRPDGSFRLRPTGWVILDTLMGELFSVTA